VLIKTKCAELGKKTVFGGVIPHRWKRNWEEMEGHGITQGTCGKKYGPGSGRPAVNSEGGQKRNGGQKGSTGPRFKTGNIGETMQR